MGHEVTDINLLPTKIKNYSILYKEIQVVPHKELRVHLLKRQIG